MRTHRKICIQTINIFSTCHHTPRSCASIKHTSLLRTFHSSSHLYDTSGKVSAANVCETLPDITIIWPFHMWPSDCAANLLNGLQTTTGLPWWGSLLMGGFCAKFVLFSFNIYSYRKLQHFFRTSPKQLTSFGLTYLNNIVTKGEKHSLAMAEDERRFTLFRATKRVREVMFSHVSYKPLSLVAGIHMSMIGGIHWLNRIQYVPLLSGGLPWCSNLTLSDPYLILPAVCIATGLFNFYYHPIHWILPLPKFKPTYILHLSPLLIVIFSTISSLPVDLVLYLTAMNCSSVLFNIILKKPAVHNELGILSSGEVLNRMIPTKETFIDLSKTLDRQNLLLADKKEQMLLLEQRKKQPLLQNALKPELIMNHCKSFDASAINGKHLDTPNQLESGITFVKSETLSQETVNDSKPHQPHHIKKVFKTKQELQAF